MLSKEELNNVFNWLPYRNDWPIDRNMQDDGIENYYGDIISRLMNNQRFNSYMFDNGGMANYLSIICYRKGEKEYSGVSILVLISLCAPIAAYFQTESFISDVLTASGNILAEQAGVVTLSELREIETQINSILECKGIHLLTKEFLSQELSQEVIDSLICPLGDRYLHAVFQIGG
jgi:hypothetical protein